MADYVKIKKNGLFQYDWNYELKKAAEERGEPIGDQERFYEETEVDIDKAWAALRCECEVDDGVTILDVFRIVDKYDTLKAFIRQYSWCRAIDKFHKAAENPLVELTDDGTTVSYAEAYWHCSHSRGIPDWWYGFHAIGTDENDQPERFCISYSPPNEYASLPFRLNKKVSYTAGNVTVTDEKCFSLLEVLDAIYDDISFMGSPEDNKEFLGDCRYTVDKIKKELENDD